MFGTISHTESKVPWSTKGHQASLWDLDVNIFLVRNVDVCIDKLFHLGFSPGNLTLNKDPVNSRYNIVLQHYHSCTFWFLLSVQSSL